jgi:hypothetical protein
MLRIFLLENLKGRHNLKDQGADGRIVLVCVFEKDVGRFGLGAYGLGLIPVVNSCEHGK